MLGEALPGTSNSNSMGSIGFLRGMILETLLLYATILIVNLLVFLPKLKNGAYFSARALSSFANQDFHLLKSLFIGRISKGNSFAINTNLM